MLCLCNKSKWFQTNDPKIMIEFLGFSVSINGARNGGSTSYNIIHHQCLVPTMLGQLHELCFAFPPVYTCPNFMRYNFEIKILRVPRSSIPFTLLDCYPWPINIQYPSCKSLKCPSLWIYTNSAELNKDPNVFAT